MGETRCRKRKGKTGVRKTKEETKKDVDLYWNYNGNCYLRYNDSILLSSEKSEQ